VIDGQSGTLFVVAMTKENGAYLHRLHALDIATGKEKFGGPVVIQASVAGSGGQVTFNGKFQLQRPALQLSNGVIYICFGSFSDWKPYRGWIMGYDASTLKQVVVRNTTPNGGEGSIWQAGAPLSLDAAGNIFGIVANGTFDPDGGDYGDSVLKLTSKTLTITDYFTPFNQEALNDNDEEIGSAGFTILPDQNGAFPHLGITAGKEGKIYLLNRDHLGQFHADVDSQIPQYIPNAVGSSSLTNDRNYSTAAYWQGNVYLIGNQDVIKQFRLTNGLLSTSPVAVGTHVYAFPGANASVSGNGASNGIVWTIEAGGVNTLHAYDAADVSRELYNSRQSGERDEFGAAVRFTLPTIMNGKVYVAGGTELAVFGLF
jgi:hypothetical protein